MAQTMTSPNLSRRASDSISPLATMLLACLVALLCYFADEIVYVLGIPPGHFASFWPAAPFLVAVLLLAPRRIWSLLIATGLAALAIADFKNGVAVASEIWYFLANLADLDCNVGASSPVPRGAPPQKRGCLG